jgi:hypothetical protein
VIGAHWYSAFGPRLYLFRVDFNPLHKRVFMLERSVAMPPCQVFITLLLAADAYILNFPEERLLPVTFNIPPMDDITAFCLNLNLTTRFWRLAFSSVH